LAAEANHDGGAPIPIVPPPLYATAEATKAHTIYLSWPSVPFAEKYLVSYSKNQSGPPWEETIDDNIYNEYYTVKGLSPGALYYFLISANNSNKETIRTFSASATTLPLKEAEKNPITLDRNKWTDGEITSDNPDKEIWYSLSTPYNSDGYFIWWNDSGDGDGSKTLDVMVDAYYNYDDRNDISFERYQDNGWTNNMRFTSYANARSMKLRVYPKNSGETGTFAIVFSESSTRL